jgi:hypothetical protein
MQVEKQLIMKRKMGKLSADWWKLGTRSFDFGQDQTEKHSSRKATETQEMAVVEVEDEMKWKKGRWSSSKMPSP